MNNLAMDETIRLKAVHESGIADEPINVIFEKITRMAKLLFRVPIVTITVMEKDKQLLKSVQGLDIDETDPEVSFCVHTIKQPNVMVVNDATMDERFRDNPLVTGGPNIRFYAGCPISLNDQQRIGTLCVIDNKPRKFSEEEMNCLQDLAAMVEIEVNKKYLNKRVHDLSSTLTTVNQEKIIDELTNVYNRRGIKEKYYAILNEPPRGKGFYLIMMDMDNLKTINDKLGHKQGDATLKGFAKICVATIRPSDFFGRLGGDEFIALIQTDQKDKLNIILERLKRSIKELSITEENIIVGVSMGAVCCRYDAHEDFETVMNKADALLYQAKRNGKNQFIIG